MATWKGGGRGGGGSGGGRSGSGGGSGGFRGGPGHGGGRSGGQPTVTSQGGPGHGGGRSGGQPTVTSQGGPGHGGGRSGGQPTVTSQGGPGQGGGRAGGQPRVQPQVDFGGTSRRGSAVSSTPDDNPRAHTSIGSASGERSPRVADPEGAFIFALEIEGIEIAQFKECSGLKSSTAIFELQEGGMNHRVHKLPGQGKWENIVLRYAVTSDTSLLAWRNEILQDDFASRRNGSIVLKTLQLEEVRRYNFIQGWPVSWEGPHFQAANADLAVEMIEIAHSGIQVT